MWLTESIGRKDVFAEMNVKPWWENVIAQTLLVISASTVFYIAATSGGIITCLPSTPDGGASLPGLEHHSEAFGDAEMAFTSLKCKAFLPRGWILTNFWWLSTLVSILLFIANNFWEYNTSVVTTIKQLKNFYDEFDKNEYPGNKEMLDLVSTVGEPYESLPEIQQRVAMKEADQRKKSRKLWKGFLYYDKTNFGFLYRLRNGISLVVAVSYNIVSVLILASLIHVDDQFNCVIEEVAFVCLYTSQPVIFPVVMTYWLMSFVQCSIFFALWYKYRHMDNNDIFIYIINQSGLGKSASHIWFEALRQFVLDNKERLLTRMYNKKQHEERFKNFIDAIRYRDDEFFSIYKLAGGEFMNALVELGQEMKLPRYWNDVTLQCNWEEMKDRLVEIAGVEVDFNRNMEPVITQKKSVVSLKTIIKDGRQREETDQNGRISVTRERPGSSVSEVSVSVFEDQSGA